MFSLCKVLIEMILNFNILYSLKQKFSTKSDVATLCMLSIWRYLGCHAQNPANIDNALEIVYRYASYIHMHVLVCWFV